MVYFIIIRGPAGVGKSTLSKKLAELLRANHIAFDKVMSEHNLDIIEGDGISAENFVKANKLVLKKALDSLKKGEIVIFDGCFYREEQLKHLLENIPHKSYVFSLKAPVDTCVSRNRGRLKDMSDEAIHDVHKLVSKHELGIPIETNNKTIEEVTKEIMSYINSKS